MTTQVIPDAAAVAREWAASEATIAQLVGGSQAPRISTRLPIEPLMPYIRITPIAGTVDLSGAPIARFTVQFDAFASTGGTRNTPDLRTSSQIARTIEARARDFEAKLLPDTDAYLYAISVVTFPVPVLDDVTTYGRFRLDLLFIYRPREED